MIAFLRKEWMEHIRTGRFYILLILFGLFGVMNPAIAKLTPWMMEILSDSLESAGFVMTEVNVSAMDSWIQFYKNVPMALLVFVLLFSQTFTGEYQKGTLIPIVTKGFSRKKIVYAKLSALLSIWTICFLICYGITYAYNAYFWDNHIVKHPFFAAMCYWLFGIWVLLILVTFSARQTSNVQVLLGTAAVVFITYLLGFLPKLSKYMPSKLMSGTKILQGITTPKDCISCIVITCILSVICVFLAVSCFKRHKL